MIVTIINTPDYLGGVVFAPGDVIDMLDLVAEQVIARGDAAWTKEATPTKTYPSNAGGISGPLVTSQPSGSSPFTLPLDKVGGRTIARFTPPSAAVYVPSALTEDAWLRMTLIGGVDTPPNTTAFAPYSQAARDYVFDNTTGQDNIYTFFVLDGTAYFSAAKGKLRDLIAPAYVSATVGNSAPSNVIVLMGEDLDQTGAAPAASAFTVAGHTVSSTAWGDSARKVVLTLSAPMTYGETTRAITYTQPGSNKLRDAAGNNTASFSGTVTNNLTDTTAPAFSSAVINDGAATLLVLTFDEDLVQTGSPPAAAAFAVTGSHAVSSAAWGTVRQVVLTLGTGFTYGEATRQVSYTKPGSNKLQDAAGNETASFSGQNVTNNLSAPTNPAVPITFSGGNVISGMVLDGNGDCQNTSDGDSSTQYGSQIGLSLSTSGWLQVSIPSTGIAPVGRIALQDHTNQAHINELDYLLYFAGGSVSVVKDGTQVSTFSVTPGSNTVIALARNPANQILALSSETGGGPNISDWTTAYTYAATASGTLYGFIANPYTHSGQGVRQPKQRNFA